MRYDYQRKYKDGDLADFLAAASALPVVEAMFTDRKLAFLLRESRIALKHFTNCTVVNGFDEMARYIKNGENR
ncbi:hypothetical protein [Nitrosomonas communis]|uniref:Uncharacterized protein n=1 Tax=Nitrosomonas communis TaxID=44574 RepID=A0A1I4LBX1_9PROT|nr:hypothetical protein [Nitrosomonas communis]SFL88440.1 hypothetical protein SAMN05421863_100661 [Nitrosomonas communis]